MKRFFAQRPLPSMTIATWRGTARVESRLRATPHQTAMISASLADDEPVDLGDDAVGQLLHLVERAALVVFGDLLVLDAAS